MLLLVEGSAAGLEQRIDYFIVFNIVPPLQGICNAVVGVPRQLVPCQRTQVYMLVVFIVFILDLQAMRL